jgi:amidohydrolase
MIHCQTQLSIEDIAKSLELYTIDLRRAFHKIPEPSWKEEKTIALLKSELNKIIPKSHYPVKITEAKGGIWVDLILNPELPWILFRADLDALPIQEETNLPFSSEHKGYMHACGHDCHIAMLLASFHAVATTLVIPKSNIRFVWQRAEECGENPSGGSLLVQEGVCHNIDFVYGLHISSTQEKNRFYSRKNLMMANSSYIEFTLTCSGGHVMRPDLGTNAISLMGDVLSHLKGFEKLYFGPNEPIAFVPSIAKAGTKSNIRPNSATFCYAIRNFLSESKRAAFVNAIKERLKTLSLLYPSAKLSSFEFIPGYPALYNDPQNHYFVKNAIEDQGIQTQETPLLFSGEDFAYYLQKTTGSFWCLGAMQEPIFDHHTSKFNPDESSLSQGVAFWLTLASKSH